MDGRTPCVFQRGCLCCHCLLAETRDRLALVDTGYGLADVRLPARRLSSCSCGQMAPDFREGMTAVRRIERLGYQAAVLLICAFSLLSRHAAWATGTARC